MTIRVTEQTSSSLLKKVLEVLAHVEQGIEQGIELGIGQGLRVQIQKKLNKGKSISQIADECEESEDTIRKIISEKGIVQ